MGKWVGQRTPLEFMVIILVNGPIAKRAKAFVSFLTSHTTPWQASHILLVMMTVPCSLTHPPTLSLARSSSTPKHSPKRPKLTCKAFSILICYSMSMTRAPKEFNSPPPPPYWLSKQNAFMLFLVHSPLGGNFTQPHKKLLIEMCLGYFLSSPSSSSPCPSKYGQ